MVAYPAREAPQLTRPGGLLALQDIVMACSPASPEFVKYNSRDTIQDYMVFLFELQREH